MVVVEGLIFSPFGEGSFMPQNASQRVNQDNQWSSPARYTADVPG